MEEDSNLKLTNKIALQRFSESSLKLANNIKEILKKIPLGAGSAIQKIEILLIKLIPDQVWQGRINEFVCEKFGYILGNMEEKIPVLSACVYFCRRGSDGVLIPLINVISNTIECILEEGWIVCLRSTLNHLEDIIRENLLTMNIVFNHHALLNRITIPVGWIRARVNESALVLSIYEADNRLGMNLINHVRDAETNGGYDYGENRGDGRGEGDGILGENEVIERVDAEESFENGEMPLPANHEQHETLQTNNSLNLPSNRGNGNEREDEDYEQGGGEERETVIPIAQGNQTSFSNETLNRFDDRLLEENEEVTYPETMEVNEISPRVEEIQTQDGERERAEGIIPNQTETQTENQTPNQTETQTEIQNQSHMQANIQNEIQNERSNETETHIENTPLEREFWSYWRKHHPQPLASEKTNPKFTGGQKKEGGSKQNLRYDPNLRLEQFSNPHSSQSICSKPKEGGKQKQTKEIEMTEEWKERVRKEYAWRQDQNQKWIEGKLQKREKMNIIKPTPITEGEEGEGEEETTAVYGKKSQKIQSGHEKLMQSNERAKTEVNHLPPLLPLPPILPNPLFLPLKKPLPLPKPLPLLSPPPSLSPHSSPVLPLPLKQYSQQQKKEERPSQASSQLSYLQNPTFRGQNEEENGFEPRQSNQNGKFASYKQIERRKGRVNEKRKGKGKEISRLDTNHRYERGIMNGNEIHHDRSHFIYSSNKPSNDSDFDLENKKEPKLWSFESLTHPKSETMYPEPKTPISTHTHLYSNYLDMDRGHREETEMKGREEEDGDGSEDKLEKWKLGVMEKESDGFEERKKEEDCRYARSFGYGHGQWNESECEET